MGFLKSSSIVQQYLNTFTQIAIIILTSTTKAPNFYYILKLVTSIYFPSVSEWNEPPAALKLTFFGKNMTSVGFKFTPKNPYF
jgi:hypothetical protein